MRRVASPPNGSRVIFSCTELAIFDTSRSSAPKLALVPGSGFLAQDLVWEQDAEKDRK